MICVIRMYGKTFRLTYLLYTALPSDCVGICNVRCYQTESINHKSPMQIEKSQPECKRIITTFTDFLELTVDERELISRSASEINN